MLDCLTELPVCSPPTEALLALLPLGGGGVALVPSAAPVHVLALLGAGASDAAPAAPAPAWAGAGAVTLGGL